MTLLPGFVYHPAGSVTEDTLYERRRITDTYLRGIELPAPAIALLVQENSIFGVGLLERGAAITTFQRRITVAGIELLSQPRDVPSLLARLKGHALRHGSEAFDSGGPIPPATWRAVRELLDADPELNTLIARLERHAAPPRWVYQTESRPRQVVEQEQDAAGLALSLGGLEREALEKWTATDDPAPFLAGVDHVELREDQLLVHDMLIFGDWDRTNVNGLWAEFTDRRDRRVTVMNVNRYELESTLGVDLIYYSHVHGAFTIVQYKRMRWESPETRLSREPVYRPAHDKNLVRQLERMRGVEKGARIDPPRRMVDYRLRDSFCFLKVCRPDLDLGTSELSKGMYMDLDLWELVLTHLSNKEANPAISFDRGGRYLNNTEFIDLVRQGWIGSRDVMSERVGRYIESELRSRHSVTLATATA